MTRSIILSNGMECLVDDEDFLALSAESWMSFTNGKGGAFYAICRRTGKRMHRLLLSAKSGQLVDHKNGNGLDNRRENLRLVNASQNNANRRKVRAKSGYKGVVACCGTHSGKWQALIKVQNKNHWVGRFSNPRDAALAYDKAAIRHFGEHAATNADLGLL